MSSEMVNCYTCRGGKVALGIGGIEKECWACKGSGKVEKIVLKAVPATIATSATQAEEVVAPGVKPKKKAPKRRLSETTTAVEAFKDMGVPAEVIEAAEAVKGVCDAVTVDMFPVHTSGLTVEVPKPIYAGYSDALMKAILEEQSMPGPVWKAKHKNNNELFICVDGNIVGEIMDVRQRCSLREQYAKSQAIAPRSYNIMASQDAI